MKKMRRTLSALLSVLMLMSITSGTVFAEQKAHDEYYYYGDANLDGKINTADATLVLKHCSGQDVTVIGSDPLKLQVADANADTYLNTADATYILRICAGMESALVCAVTVADIYNITYEAGIVTDKPVILPANTTAEEGSTFTVTEVATLDGEVFEGWISSFDNTVYTVGQSFTMPSCDVVLTAKWAGSEIPTPPMTEEPTPPVTDDPNAVTVTLNLYDYFNETPIDIIEREIPGNSTHVNTSNIQLPDGYNFMDANFSEPVSINNGVATPSVFNVPVYPCAVVDNVEFKVINTIQGFLNVQDDLTGNYMLGQDIDMASIDVFMPFGWDWSNVDAEDTYFTGIFDGNGHTIRNLHIRFTIEVFDDGTYSTYKNVGLFAVNNGTIRNLTVYTRPFTGDMNYGVYGDINVGIIAGYNLTTIENCHTFGNVGSFDYIDNELGAVGGICGTNGVDGKVSRCSHEGSVEGFFYAGGLLGKNFGILEESYFAGGVNWDVEAQFAYDYNIWCIGGLVGGAQDAIIRNCYCILTYNVSGNQGIGGIVGWINGGSIENSYVMGAEHILFIQDGTGGAFVGYTVTEPATSGLYIYNEYAGMPPEYDTNIWDLNGESYATMPDLMKNRRPAVLFDAIAD